MSIDLYDVLLLPRPSRVPKGVLFLRRVVISMCRMRMGTDVAAGSAQACTNEDGFLPGEVIPCLKSVSRGTHYRHTYAVYETHPDTGQVFGVSR